MLVFDLGIESSQSRILLDFSTCVKLPYPYFLAFPSLNFLNMWRLNELIMALWDLYCFSPVVKTFHSLTKGQNLC